MRSGIPVPREKNLGSAERGDVAEELLTEGVHLSTRETVVSVHRCDMERADRDPNPFAKVRHAGPSQDRREGVAHEDCHAPRSAGVSDLATGTGLGSLMDTEGEQERELRRLGGIE